MYGAWKITAGDLEVMELNKGPYGENKGYQIHLYMLQYDDKTRVSEMIFIPKPTEADIYTDAMRHGMHECRVCQQRRLKLWDIRLMECDIGKCTNMPEVCSLYP